ncbi:MAG: glycosyltransferase 87 family protein [Solirubrobacteraceae bacterium]
MPLTPRAAGGANTAVSVEDSVAAAQPYERRSLRRALAGPTGAGSIALVGLVIAGFVLAAGAASRPSDNFVPKSTEHFPGWIAGPLHFIALKASFGVLEAVLAGMCVCYAIAVWYATKLGGRRLWAAIVLTHVGAFLAPPVLSSDVFDYIGFARLGVLHGLSPYSYTANAAPHDAIFHYLGWTTVTTPYGPLFTLLTYAMVPLGIVGGLWTLKAIAVLTSLATVALVWRIATALGRPPERAVAMYALSPLLLVFTVAGAHNDTLFGMLVAAGALCILTARERAAGVSLVLAAAVKISAGLVLPFAILGSKQRWRLALEVLAGLAVVVLVSALTIDAHLLAIPRALLAQQRQVAIHSVPSEVTKLLGLAPHWVAPHKAPLAEGVRLAFVALFAVALLAALWRTWRGSWWLDCYAWATLALIVCTAWLLPWYGVWALLPASVSSSRRLRAVTLVVCAYLIVSF